MSRFITFFLFRTGRRPNNFHRDSDPQNGSKRTNHKPNLYPMNNSTCSSTSIASNCSSILTKSNRHVIFPIKRFKMLAILLQIAFLMFSLSPTCQASGFMHPDAESDKLHNVTHRLSFYKGGGTTPRISTSRQSNHRLLAPVSAAPTRRHTEGNTRQVPFSYKNGIQRKLYIF